MGESAVLDGRNCTLVPNNKSKHVIFQECACVIGDASTCEIGVPHWVGDDFCDDVNNNVMCGFDGGDCCPPHARPAGIWDWYCNDCECLQPRLNVF